MTTWYTRNHMSGRTPPTEKGKLIVGNLWEFRRDPLGLLRSLREKHGDVVRFRLVTDQCYLLSHPDHVQHVLRDNSSNYRKALFFDKIKVFLGNGLLPWSFEDDFWRGRRRLLQPPFRPRSLHGFLDMWVGATNELIARWRVQARAGAQIDAFREMMAHSLDLAARTLLSCDGRSADGEVVIESLATCMEHLMYKVEALIDLPEYVPTRQNRRFLAARGALDEVMYRLIDERRRAGTMGSRTESETESEADQAPDDLLTLLIRANETADEPVSDRQLRDDLLTMFVAGFETNSSTLAWTLWLMAQHPDYAEAMRQEVLDVVGDRDPTLDDLSSLSLTRMIIQEAMRLYPPAWWVARAALADDVVGDYHIPAGSTVVVSQYVTHRHPAFWKDPEKFDPFRFTPERSAARPALAYFPFGAGPRGCIGWHFAMVQIQLIVAMVARQFRLVARPGYEVGFLPLVTLRPRNPVLLGLEELREPDVREPDVPIQYGASA